MIILYIFAGFYIVSILFNLVYVLIELIKEKAEFKSYLITPFVVIIISIFGLIVAREVFDNLKDSRDYWQKKYNDEIKEVTK